MRKRILSTLLIISLIFNGIGIPAYAEEVRVESVPDNNIRIENLEESTADIEDVTTTKETTPEQTSTSIEDTPEQTSANTEDASEQTFESVEDTTEQTSMTIEDIAEEDSQNTEAIMEENTTDAEEEVSTTEITDTSLTVSENEHATSDDMKTEEEIAKYITKITFKRGATSVYTGQSDIKIGTVSFEAEAEIVDFSEKNVADITDSTGITLYVIDKDIYMSVDKVTNSEVLLGKHTIQVKADAPEGVMPATDTLSVTILQGIDKIEKLEAPDRIYKESGKEVSFPTQLTYGITPQTRRVIYQIVDANGEELSQEHPLYGKIKVNETGVVTVLADFVPDEKQEKNQFRVEVRAADYAGNSTFQRTEMITITQENLEIGRMFFGILQPDGSYQVLDIESEATPGKLLGARVIALKKGVEEEGFYEKNVYTKEEIASYAITGIRFTSNVKELTLTDKEGEGVVISHVTAPLRWVTLTGTLDDGSKVSSRIRFNVDYDVIEKELGFGIRIHGKETFINTPEETSMNIRGIADMVLEVVLMEKEEDGSWSQVENSIYEHHLKVKKGTEISGETYNVHYVKMTGEETIVNLSYEMETEKKSVAYCIKNEDYKLKNNPVPVVKVTGTINHGIRMEINRGKYDTEGRGYILEADGTDKINRKEAYEALEKSISLKPGEIQALNGESSQKYDILFQDVSQIPTGKYRMNVIFGYEDENGDFIPDTKAVSITISKTERETMKYWAVTGVRLSETDGAGVVLRGSGKNYDAGTECYSDARNILLNGKANCFTDFFIVSTEEDGKSYLSLKKDLSIEQLKYITGKNGKDDRTGYVKYYVQDRNGISVRTGYTKITVKFVSSQKHYSAQTVTVFGEEAQVAGKVSARVEVGVNNGRETANIAYVCMDEKNNDGFYPEKTDYGIEGTNTVTLVADSITTGKKNVYFYVVPEGVYAEGIRQRTEEGISDTELEALVRTYGIRVVSRVRVEELKIKGSRKNGTNVNVTQFAGSEAAYEVRGSYGSDINGLEVSLKEDSIIESAAIGIATDGSKKGKLIIKTRVMDKEEWENGKKETCLEIQRNGRTIAGGRISVIIDWREIPMTSFELNWTKIEQPKNTQFQLEITEVTPIGANSAIFWESTNGDIATVDEKGLVSLNNEGMAVILAYTENQTILQKCLVLVQSDETIPTGTLTPQMFRSVEDADDTNAFNEAIENLEENGTLYVPAGTYQIDALTGIRLKSNMNLIMSPEAVLKALPNGEKNSNVIRGSYVKNINISGGTIVGERYEHTGTSGEWGMGICLNDCKRITIDNVKISDCWGDGIYLGAHDDFDVTDGCYYITITNCTLSNNRRNNLSIVSAENVEIDNCNFLNANGTAPESGIDIETNYSENPCEKITITNSYFEGNQYAALEIPTQADTVEINNCTLKGDVINWEGENVSILNSEIYGELDARKGIVSLEGTEINEGELTADTLAGVFVAAKNSIVPYTVGKYQVDNTNVMSYEFISDDDGNDSYLRLKRVTSGNVEAGYTFLLSELLTNQSIRLQPGKKYRFEILVRGKGNWGVKTSQTAWYPMAPTEDGFYTCCVSYVAKSEPSPYVLYLYATDRVKDIYLDVKSIKIYEVQ